MREPPTAALFAVAAAALAYELAVALTSPPNNWDSLTYHLPRVAQWAQEGGIQWIANAPTDRLNEFQPIAEYELLFVFAALGNGALYALPQYAGQVAILIAAYGSSRRLGFSLTASAAAAFLFATFSLVALQAMTAQNDLVAASFPVVAACLILGGTPVELAAAGAAVGIALGVKLTTALVLPVLLWLVLQRGRRPAAVAGAGAAAGFLVVGMWGYVLNIVHTGHLLGRGGGRVENTTPPTMPGSLVTAARLVYRTLDLSVLSNPLIVWLAVIGIAVGATAAAERGSTRRAALQGLPFLFPALVWASAVALAFLTRVAHIPAQTDSPIGGLNRFANEDYSAFGPVGAVTVLVTPVAIAAAYARRRVDRRQLALALAFPTFLVLTALSAKYNPFMTRFMLVPAALSAPLLAHVFRDRLVTASVAVVAAITVGLTLEHNRTKPFNGPHGHPWQLSQVEALEQNWQPASGPALAAYDGFVPPRACVGAIVGPEEPSYVLWGPRLGRQVVYLPSVGAVGAATGRDLPYVVLSSSVDPWLGGDFANAGWDVQPLGDYWLLAFAPPAEAAGVDRARC
jgi:hypothetical protein